MKADDLLFRPLRVRELGDGAVEISAHPLGVPARFLLTCVTGLCFGPMAWGLATSFLNAELMIPCCAATLAFAWFPASKVIFGAKIRFNPTELRYSVGPPLFGRRGRAPYADVHGFSTHGRSRRPGETRVRYHVVSILLRGEKPIQLGHWDVKVRAEVFFEALKSRLRSAKLAGPPGHELR